MRSVGYRPGLTGRRAPLSWEARFWESIDALVVESMLFVCERGVMGMDVYVFIVVGLCWFDLDVDGVVY